MPKITYVLFEAVAVVLCHQRPSAAAPVTGDAKMLAVLRDAQTTAEASFSTGRFRWQLTEDRQDGRLESDGTITWSGENTRWEYRYVQRDSSGRRTSAQGADGAYLRSLRTPREMVTYGPDQKTAMRAFDRSQSMPHYVDLLPQQSWFCTSVYSAGRWSEMLDPELNGTRLESTSVQRMEGDRIRVTRHHRGGLPDYWFVFSLRMGGNVIEYGHDSNGTDDPFAGAAEHGTLEWRPVGDGRFSLARREHVFEHPRRPEYSHKIVLTITDFDPAPQLPANYFTFEGLGIANGTTVTVRGAAQKKYVVGNPDSRLDDAALEKLSEKLRTSGFGAAERQ